MKVEDVAKDTPRFDFIAYFTGTTGASGWFADRFGTVRRHFDGEFIGSLEEDTFTLKEILRYTDGVTEEREWYIRVDDEGRITATSDSLVGEAKGTQQGNTVNLKYRMYVQLANDRRWLLTVNDWLFLQADGSVHNVSEVYKWGIKIGSVSNIFSKGEVGQNAIAPVDTTRGMTTDAVVSLFDTTADTSQQAAGERKIHRVGQHAQ